MNLCDNDERVDSTNLLMVLLNLLRQWSTSGGRQVILCRHCSVISLCMSQMETCRRVVVVPRCVRKCSSSRVVDSGAESTSGGGTKTRTSEGNCVHFMSFWRPKKDGQHICASKLVFITSPNDIPPIHNPHFSSNRMTWICG